jgi:hypothetical protein
MDMPGRYAADRVHIADYAVRTRTVEGVARYLREVVSAVPTAAE